jgi:uncharacterized protein YndB with AHSA1/START domain
MEKKIVHIQTRIQAPLPRVWDEYNNPESIKKWNQASPDWHCPSSENDLKTGGRFKNTMAAKDGSFSFDFSGTYTKVKPLQQISYQLDDEREVHIQFAEQDGNTTMDIHFEAEVTNPIDMQEAGWQSILDSFKQHVETNS